MKIAWPEPSCSFEEFADRNDFVLRVRERGPDLCRSLPRYFVRFEGVEVMDGLGGLRGSSGNGETLDEAVADYAAQIAGCRLAYHAYRGDRREVEAPTRFTSTTVKWD